MAKLSKENIPFTQVANEVLNDKTLSWKAKGLFAYLFSKPEGWDFSADRIATNGTDGRKAVLGGLSELEKAGYLSRKKLGNRRMDYDLKYSKSQNGTLSQCPNVTVPKRHSAQTALISNIDSESNKETESNNTITAPVASNGKDISEIIFLFKEVNPSYNRLFVRKNQRDAVERLLKQWPRPQLDNIVKVIQQTNSMKYAPAITTPLELEEKMGKLKAFIESQRQAKKSKEKVILGL